MKKTATMQIAVVFFSITVLLTKDLEHKSTTLIVYRFYVPIDTLFNSFRCFRKTHCFVMSHQFIVWQCVNI